jgi:alkylation response protein AidB-like acyl-CoA dehydrogenase
MDWSFDPDQLEFRDAVRDVLRAGCDPAVVRAAGSGQLDRKVWSALAEMGVCGILAAENSGGLGLDERWLVLLLEEAGYVALPHPIVETAAVLMPLVADRVPPDALLTTDLGGPLIPCLRDADAVLLRAGEGLELLSPSDVEATAVATVDPARRAGRASGRGVPVPADLARARDRGAWGTAAYLLGLGQRMLDDTVGYVRTREQFGVPIGSFQAIKHHLADAALQLTFARPAVHRAAWSLAVRAPDAGRDVSMAKVMAGEAVRVIGRNALQCHGAIGYTEEYDLQLFLKRSWALSRSWGDAGTHRARLLRSRDAETGDDV